MLALRAFAGAIRQVEPTCVDERRTAQGVESAGFRLIVGRATGRDLRVRSSSDVTETRLSFSSLQTYLRLDEICLGASEGGATWISICPGLISHTSSHLSLPTENSASSQTRGARRLRHSNQLGTYSVHSDANSSAMSSRPDARER